LLGTRGKRIAGGARERRKDEQARQRPEQLMHSVVPSEPIDAMCEVVHFVRSKLRSRYHKVDSQLSRVGNTHALLQNNCGNNQGN
jgi:hypothetical protein